MKTAFYVEIFWDVDAKKIRYRLLQAAEIHIEPIVQLTIPKGYVTDFATVPRIFWSIVPPIGKHNPAALVHDYLYDNRLGTRLQADHIFLNVMLHYGVPKITAYIMYYAVRIGGRKWWKN